jgi:hypothetical protein
MQQDGGRFMAQLDNRVYVLFISSLVSLRLNIVLGHRDDLF